MHPSDKSDLIRIARAAMSQRGLLPDFSSEVLAQTDGITAAATVAGPDVLDLRRLPWASIDNDDSLDGFFRWHGGERRADGGGLVRRPASHQRQAEQQRRDHEAGEE